MNNKNTLLIAAGVIAVIIIVALVVGKSDDSGLSLDPSASPTGLTSVSPSTSASPMATAKPATLTYATALQKYGNTRMQFNAQCQATPSRMVLKNGSALMFDNRANVSRIITFNGVRYSAPAYGFRIVTASGAGKTVLIDCGTSQNVATVVIEK